MTPLDCMKRYINVWHPLLPDGFPFIYVDGTSLSRIQVDIVSISLQFVYILSASIKAGRKVPVPFVCLCRAAVSAACP